MHKFRNAKRRGFTLVELTVVILIIGVIATIAAPKFFSSVEDAQENSAISSLTTIRNAISLYKANNNGYPGTDETTFKSALDAYLRNGIPKCPVGNRDATVRVEASGSPLAVSGTQSWCYDNKTGEFRINHADFITY